MPRPKTKNELITLSQQNFEKLFSMINSLDETEKQTTFSFEGRDRNIRDVLVHLYEWHQLLWKFIQANLVGKYRPFLPEPYNWKTYPKMNIEFWQKHQSTPLEKAIADFQESHTKIMALITQFNDENLFTKKYYSWTGSTSLGSYIISSTSSHYEWALKIIKKQIKSLKNLSTI
ncbi:ClbS/DfsB family four-helix bundle protein [Rodentibacter pneumotropicus]|uniref:ClbS/DfsB family four-helix bundle protein n=1 Tax=Rodentibacter pneumotropicus TaxID=758 RepID=UPI00232E41E8|nr:ClbS/DfsB family four-helix bundle protein [Rodentibacter pneumotropicus]MDC2826345.1 ClbS/DfsB family four-helix bundle protein [Rodentibacter pneumotropicus]